MNYNQLRYNKEHQELIQQLHQSAMIESNIISENKKFRQEVNEMDIAEEQTENQLDALSRGQGQFVGELINQLSGDKFIVRINEGGRWIVGCRSPINPTLLKVGDRVAMDMTTMTIMRRLPTETNAAVHSMLEEDPGSVTYQSIGGLNDQIRELREAIELPLKNPELFKRIGIKPPKGVLLYGPPGTGKTLLARAIANEMDCNFMKIVSSSIVDKYIGESARLIREMFAYAREHTPCIIFFDEIDAIGGKRLSAGTSADREIQRTLMELLNQIDGFTELGMVKIVMATNRPDILDPALLRPGRLDRKIEIPLPNGEARMQILQIHGNKLTHKDNIEFKPIVSLSEGFNGADLRNVCTEAGMFAIRAYRKYVIQEDFQKAVRKVKEGKKLEAICGGAHEYKKL